MAQRRAYQPVALDLPPASGAAQRPNWKRVKTAVCLCATTACLVAAVTSVAVAAGSGRGTHAPACAPPPPQLLALPGLPPGYAMPVIASVPLVAGGGARVELAVVMQHGTARNAGDYYCTAARAAQMANLQASVAVVAPHFMVAEDAPPNGVLYWDHNSNWKQGDLSTAALEQRVSSFVVLQELVERLRAALPALREVVVAGHSAGGQVVQRFALGAPPPAAGLAVRYVAANPSSFAYLDDVRPNVGAGANYSYPARVPAQPPLDWAPLPARACPGYDAWKYGLDNGTLNNYMEHAVEAAGGVEALRERFVRQDVTYLLGTNDTCNAVLQPSCGADHNLDTTCKAMAQGPWRLARGQAFFAFLQRFYGDHAGFNHKISLVPFVGHDHDAMFCSAQGLAALFGGGER